MTLLPLKSLYRRFAHVVLGAMGLGVFFGMELCLPVCPDEGVSSRRCETFQVLLMEGITLCGNRARGGWRG